MIIELNSRSLFGSFKGPVFYQFGYQVNDKHHYYGHNYQGHMEHVDGHTTTGWFGKLTQLKLLFLKIEVFEKK